MDVDSLPRSDDPIHKRKRPSSASPPSRSSKLPRPNGDPIWANGDDENGLSKGRDRARELAEIEKELAQEKAKEKVDPKVEMNKMAMTRGGGTYIPPFRLARMNIADPTDKSSQEYQRLRWEALRKSINGLINKVNTANIKMIVPELFGENLIRGRGLFCRSIIRAQSSSLPYTPVFASLAAIVNTKFPQIGELLCHRLISRFRKAYRRNNKPDCISAATFMAHLINQQVLTFLTGLELVALCLKDPTDDSVEIAVGFMKEVGAHLSDLSDATQAVNEIYARFREILQGTEIDKRAQYSIEILFKTRKDKFKDNPPIPQGLDLVEEDDVICHEVFLDSDNLETKEGLNIFKYDPEYLKEEERYQMIKNEILGDDSDEDESGDGDDEDGDEGVDEDAGLAVIPDTVDIQDHTGMDLVNLRKSIYLTIMSALDFEEAVHKLLKIELRESQEIELCNMIIECCSQERSYSKFYGLMGERFCKLNLSWAMCYQECFKNYYDTIHRFETNRLRNIARFFGHLLGTDAISWTVFEVVKMNEDDTTSSSRIFVKILFNEMQEMMGLKTLAERFKSQDPLMKAAFAGMFPVDNPKNTRFSINYFTSLGLGLLTEDMREHLKRAPQLIMAQRRAIEDASSSDSDSSSSLSSSTVSSSTVSSSSDSDSEISASPPRRKRRPSSPPVRRRQRSFSRSPPLRRGERRHTPSPPRSPSRNPRRRYSLSSPPRDHRRSSISPSPPHKTRTNGTNGTRRSPPPPSRQRYPSRSSSRSPSPPPPRRVSGYDKDRYREGRDRGSRR